MWRDWPSENRRFWCQTPSKRCPGMLRNNFLEASWILIDTLRLAKGAAKRKSYYVTRLAIRKSMILVPMGSQTPSKRCPGVLRSKFWKQVCSVISKKSQRQVRSTPFWHNLANLGAILGTAGRQGGPIIIRSGTKMRPNLKTWYSEWGSRKNLKS